MALQFIKQIAEFLRKTSQPCACMKDL